MAEVDQNITEFVQQLFPVPTDQAGPVNFWEIFLDTTRSIDQELQKNVTYSRNNRQLQAKFDQLATLAARFTIVLDLNEADTYDLEHVAAYWSLFYSLDNETIAAKEEIFRQNVKTTKAGVCRTFNTLIKYLFNIRKNASLAQSTISITVLPLSKFIDKLFVWSLSMVTDL